jgi:hypothetical protein
MYGLTVNDQHNTPRKYDEDFLNLITSIGSRIYVFAFLYELLSEFEWVKKSISIHLFGLVIANSLTSCLNSKMKPISRNKELSITIYYNL